MEGFVGPTLRLRTLLPTAPLTVRAQRRYSTTYMGSRRECSGRVIFWLRCFSACARVYVYVYVCAHVRVCACTCVPCTCVCVMHVFGCICTRVRVCVHECTSSVVVTEGAPILRSTNPEGAPTNSTLSVHMCMCVNVCMRLCTRVHVCVHVRISCVFFSLCARVHICICAPAKGFQCACACLLSSLHERACACARER